MRILGYILSFIALSTIMISCKKTEEPTCDIQPPPTLRVDVYPYYGGTGLFLDTVYDTQEGYRVKFTDIKFYLENVRNGSNQLIDAGLFDFRQRGNVLFSSEGKPADFGSLQANLGVDASINHNDPAGFPNDSWLNISNANDMHWGWNPGYIFIKVEGKVDTIPDATDLLNHNVVFHIGLDENLTTVDFTNLQWVDQGNDLHTVGLKLDMQEFLVGTTTADPIDLKTEYTSHSAVGQEAVTTNVANNFRAALTVL